MRIVHVSDCYAPRLGGIEVQVRELARRQAADGHDVTVVTSVPGHGPAGGEDGVTVVRPPQGSQPDAIRYLRTLGGRSAVLGGGFDVVHAHASTFSPLSFLAAHGAARRGWPTVVTTHSLWAYATPLFRAADRLTGWGDWPVVWSAVSTAAATELAGVLGEGAQVSVLPNGIDPARWRVEHVPGEPGELRLVSVMRLAPRKRPRHLLQMLLELRRQLPDRVRLTAEIAGEGPERPVLERFVQRHGMGAWVRLPGRLTPEEIRALYARSDVFLAPATLESFGIAAFEARAAGLPVVARAGTGVQDFVTDGREGLLADSDDAMVAAVARLAASGRLRRRIADHNRTVPPRFGWGEVLSRCTSLYAAAGAPTSELAGESEGRPTQAVAAR